MYIVIYLFLQTHKHEIDGLPEVLMEKAALLPDLLRESRADSTNSKYRYGFTRRNRWTLGNGLGSGDVFLVKALSFCSILNVIIQTANSPGSILQCKTYHGILGISSPTDSSLVVNVLEAAKRKLAKRVTKKEPSHLS